MPRMIPDSDWEKMQLTLASLYSILRIQCERLDLINESLDLMKKSIDRMRDAIEPDHYNSVFNRIQRQERENAKK